jgi:hypothetical protein
MFAAGVLAAPTPASDASLYATSALISEMDSLSATFVVSVAITSVRPSATARPRCVRLVVARCCCLSERSAAYPSHGSRCQAGASASAARSVASAGSRASVSAPCPTTTQLRQVVCPNCWAYWWPRMRLAGTIPAQLSLRTTAYRGFTFQSRHAFNPSAARHSVTHHASESCPFLRAATLPCSFSADYNTGHLPLALCTVLTVYSPETLDYAMKPLDSE